MNPQMSNAVTLPRIAKVAAAVTPAERGRWFSMKKKMTEMGQQTK